MANDTVTLLPHFADCSPDWVDAVELSVLLVSVAVVLLAQAPIRAAAMV